MNVNIFQDNEEASITTPTHISAAIPLNTMAIQQEEIYTQTEVQTYERKNTMSRKEIDERTLRIHVPRYVDTVHTISTIQTNAATSTSSNRFHLDTVLSQTKATDYMGSFRFLSVHSPSIYTMTT